MAAASLISISEHVGGSLVHCPGGGIAFNYSGYLVQLVLETLFYDLNSFVYELYEQKFLIDQMKSQLTIVWC